MAEQYDQYQAGVDYLERLLDENDKNPSPELRAEINRVAAALDPEGQRRTELSQGLVETKKAEATGAWDRFKMGAEQGLDTMSSAFGQVMASPEEKQRIYEEYQARQQARAPYMAEGVADDIGNFSALAVPGLVAGSGLAATGAGLPLLAAGGAGIGAWEGFAGGGPAPAEDYARAKAGDTALGAAIGGGLPVAFGLGARGINAGRNLARARSGALAPVDQGQGRLQQMLLDAEQGSAREGAQDMLQLAGPGARATAQPSAIAKELGVPLTRAREHYINTGDRGLLAVEEAAKRRHGSEVGARVGRDRRATQGALEDVFNNPDKLPGAGGFSPGEARAFGGRLLRHAEHLKRQEGEAWDRVKQFRDDPALDPADNSTLHIALKQVLKDEQIPDGLKGIQPLLQMIDKNIGTSEGMTVGGLSNMRKQLNAYMDDLPLESASTRRAYNLVKQRLDKAIVELQLANHNGSRMGLQAMKDAIGASARSAQFSRGKDVYGLSRTQQKTEIAKFIENMEKGRSAEGAVKSMLRGDSSSRARNVLQEIRSKMGEDAYRTAREDMRRAFFKEMKRGKFDEGGALYTEEGYISSARQMSTFIQDNKETFDALFDPTEQHKIKTAIALQRDLATPSDTANWSNTASAGMLLNTLSRLPGASKYAQPVQRFVEEGAMERNMSRLLYPE
jgi:hypothetical protein